jgi:hypothetical protein
MIGNMRVNYSAVFQNGAEVITTHAPINNTAVTSTTILENGSFYVQSVSGPATTHTVNEYISPPPPIPPTPAPPPMPQYNTTSSNASLASPRPAAPPPDNGDWQYYAEDGDYPTYNIAGVSMNYQFTEGSYCCTDSTMAIFLFAWTSAAPPTYPQADFIQVTAAWGSVNCGDTALGVPYFSIGYDNNLSNCPIGSALNTHVYTFSIQYDYIDTSQWYLEIFDQSADSYVLSQYLTVQPGTYVYPGDWGLTLEGINGATASEIPDNSQGMTAMQFFEECAPTYTCSHNVDYLQSVGSQGSPPSDVVFGSYQPSGSGTAVTDMSYCYSTGSSCGFLTVNSIDENTLQSITGYYLVLYNSGGTQLATGYTPEEFAGLTYGGLYKIAADSYGSCTFSQWLDTFSASDPEPVTALGQTVTAEYNCGGGGSGTITVVSKTAGGQEITGYSIALYSSGGTYLTSQYTTATFYETAGTGYQLYANGYGSCNFQYWENSQGTDIGGNNLQFTDNGQTYYAIYSGSSC